MGSVRIRRAELPDADAVFGLLTELATTYQPQRSRFDQTYEPLLAAMTYNTTDFLVADDGGTVIGYALASRFLVLYAPGPVSELHELVVDRAHRGRGAGRMLVEAVVDRARTAGAVEVTVPTRRAHEYYRALGFEETATLLKLPLSR
jgi:predicted N-acetyltransferase YhbS